MVALSFSVDGLLYLAAYGRYRHVLEHGVRDGPGQINPEEIESLELRLAEAVVTTHRHPKLGAALAIDDFG